MALTAQPPTHSSWGRWPQQMSQDFSMMESQGFLPYDSRTQPSSQIPRPMPPQYVVDTAYNQPQPPMPPMAAPHYQSQPAFSYVSYQSPPPSTPVGSPYKTEAPRALAENNHGNNSSNARMNPYRRASRVSEYQPRSPTSRNGSISSAVSKPHIPSPILNSKTITYNETIDPADQVNFETDVDELMKAIQKKKDEEEAKAQQTLTPAQTPRSESMVIEAPSPVNSQINSAPAAPQAEGKPKKKWVCDGPSCNKSFVQKTHLDIHRRTHTGLKPYVCNKDNCGLTFSQRGNLKTHMRRHTGEKPFACRLCGKLFAQRGNVRSHEETHKGLKPFVCRLDDCNKAFSQLGNMKTHQNNFHKDTLQKLTSKFVHFLRDGDVPEEYKELFEYFEEHYKNSNKGIKGRGKARTVAARKPKGAASQQPASAPSTASSTPVATHFSHGPLSNQQQQQHQHQVMPNPSRVPSYDMGHGPANNMDNMQRNHNHNHGHNQNGVYMFEQHQSHPQGGVMYEEDHARSMSFSNRLY